MNNTNRIALNSIALYTNMIVTMIVSLVATRFILEALGKTEYGIYALIANIVSMFSFINVAMSAATQRYLSYAIGANERQKIKEIFYSSLLIHLSIAFVLAILLSSCGLLFIEDILDIPADATDKAQTVLFCMLIGIFFTVTSVPYEAEMNAHEDIFVIAGINIIEAILKLAVSVGMLYIQENRLILYSLLIMGISGISFGCKRIYCRKHYEESHYQWHRMHDFTLIKEMTGFAGWNLIGVGASIARYQGTAILLNIFFGIVINAAYGIAQQLNGFLMFFANSTVRPLRPQIIKSEGAGEHAKMVCYSNSACRITFLLLSIAVIPLYINMPYVLSIWLKQVPEGTLSFCRNFLIITLIVQITIGLQIALESVGKIRRQQLIIGIMHLSALPVGYVLFRKGFPAHTIMWCIIVEECLNILLRILIARKDANVPAKDFITRLLFPCSVTVMTIFYLAYYIGQMDFTPVARLILTSGFTFVTLPLISYAICLTTWEKEKLHSLWASIRSKKL